MGEREGYARFLRRTRPAPRALTIEELVCDGVPALRVVPADGDGDNGPVVVHLHGGCYTMGSAEGAIDLASRLAEAIGGWALVPDYHAADPATPLISPVNADLRGLPPLLVQAAQDEALRDDAARLAEVAHTVGVKVTIELVEDTVHSFVLFDSLPETRSALEQLAAHAASALPKESRRVV